LPNGIAKWYAVPEKIGKLNSTAANYIVWQSFENVGSKTPEVIG